MQTNWVSFEKLKMFISHQTFDRSGQVMLDYNYFEQNLISKFLHPESLSLKQSEINRVKSIPNTPDQNGAASLRPSEVRLHILYN